MHLSSSQKNVAIVTKSEHLEFGCLILNFSFIEVKHISEKVKKTTTIDNQKCLSIWCFALVYCWFILPNISQSLHCLVRTSWPGMTGRKENAESGARPIRALHYCGLANQKPGIAATGMADYTQACSRDQCMWGWWSCDQWQLWNASLRTNPRQGMLQFCSAVVPGWCCLCCRPVHAVTQSSADEEGWWQRGAWLWYREMTGQYFI